MRKRKERGSYRKQLAAQRREQVAAAEEVARTWGSLAMALPADYDCTLHCTEAEAMARLLNAFGEEALADAVIEEHAEGDVCGDLHHKECDDCRESTDG